MNANTLEQLKAAFIAKGATAFVRGMTAKDASELVVDKVPNSTDKTLSYHAQIGSLFKRKKNEQGVFVYWLTTKPTRPDVLYSLSPSYKSELQLKKFKTASAHTLTVKYLETLNGGGATTKQIAAATNKPLHLVQSNLDYWMHKGNFFKKYIVGASNGDGA